MDVSQIIAKSRIQTNTSTAQKSDTATLNDLNIVQDTIFSSLSKLNKKYARTRYIIVTTVAGQNEYVLPKETTTDPLLKRLLKARIRYDNEYTPIAIYDTSFIDNDDDYEDYENPYLIQRDWSMFLYPAPKDWWADIIIEWQYIPLPLEITTLSDDIKLSKEYHDLYIKWLNQWNYADKQLHEEEELWRQKFEQRLQQMINEWWHDVDWPYEEDNNDIISTARQFLP